MIYSDRNNLGNLLRRLRTRRQLLLLLRGVAIVLGAGAAVLLLSGWAAHRYRHNDNALLALRLGALVTLLATVLLALVRPLWKRITDQRLARFIEEHNPVAEDRLVTAIECSSASPEPNISKAILERLEADANQVAGLLSLSNVIRRSRLLMYGGAMI